MPRRAKIALVCGAAGFAALGVILLPRLGRARYPTTQTSCASNLHAIAMGMLMYRDDWGAYPPPYDPVSGRGGVTALIASGDLVGVAVLRCPEDPTTLADHNRTHGTSWDRATLENRYSSYNAMYNTWGYNARGEPFRTRRGAQKTYAGRRGWQGRLLWTSGEGGGPTADFPGLANRKAPDETVITHCPWHRGQYREDQPHDLAVHLGGSVENVAVNSYDWITQPPPPDLTRSGS